MAFSTANPEPDSRRAAIVPLHSEIAGDNRAESQVRALRDRHWTMLCVALFIIAASFLLQLGEADGVTLAWLHVKLPMLCGSRALFGVDCPGCGLTRSFIALAAGDLQQSFQFHRVGWLLALAVVGQIPYRTYALWDLRRRTVQRIWPTWFGYFLIAMLTLNWLLKMSGR